MAHVSTGFETGLSGTPPPLGLIKVLTPGLLTQVSSDSPHDLMVIRSYGGCGNSQGRQLLSHKCIVIDYLKRSKCANLQDPICLPDVIEFRQAFETDYRRRRLHLVFHVYQEIGPA